MGKYGNTKPPKPISTGKGLNHTTFSNESYGADPHNPKHQSDTQAEPLFENTNVFPEGVPAKDVIDLNGVVNNYYKNFDSQPNHSQVFLDYIREHSEGIRDPEVLAGKNGLVDQVDGKNTLPPVLQEPAINLLKYRDIGERLTNSTAGWMAAEGRPATDAELAAAGIDRKKISPMMNALIDDSGGFKVMSDDQYEAAARFIRKLNQLEREGYEGVGLYPDQRLFGDVVVDDIWGDPYREKGLRNKSLFHTLNEDPDGDVARLINELLEDSGHPATLGLADAMHGPAYGINPSRLKRSPFITVPRADLLGALTGDPDTALKQAKRMEQLNIHKNSTLNDITGESGYLGPSPPISDLDPNRNRIIWFHHAEDPDHVLGRSYVNGVTSVFPTELKGKLLDDNKQGYWSRLFDDVLGHEERHIDNPRLSGHLMSKEAFGPYYEHGRLDRNALNNIVRRNLDPGNAQVLNMNNISKGGLRRFMKHLKWLRGVDGASYPNGGETWERSGYDFDDTRNRWQYENSIEEFLPRMSTIKDQLGKVDPSTRAPGWGDDDLMRETEVFRNLMDGLINPVSGERSNKRMMPVDPASGSLIRELDKLQMQYDLGTPRLKTEMERAWYLLGQEGEEDYSGLT